MDKKLFVWIFVAIVILNVRDWVSGDFDPFIYLYAPIVFVVGYGLYMSFIVLVVKVSTKFDQEVKREKKPRS